MTATVSLLFLARSAEEEEVLTKLSLTPKPWVPLRPPLSLSSSHSLYVSHVTRCTSVVLLEARRRQGGRRESDRCVIKGEVSPDLLFLENGLSFFLLHEVSLEVA
ncbi:hypothetical protein DVH24_015717 [Malus domestica]|uniref:Uncharacterized protein n=1 Tax=Malus domestica TaxID=3750 RepID=A0A498HNH3_MALDO|nr:hypothetical protein DVH24_015717 [Malus domestica]